LSESSRIGENYVRNNRHGGAIMPKIRDNFNFETEYPLETIQRKGKLIILSNPIEKEISNHPEKFSKPGSLKYVPLKMVIPTVVNQILGTEVYRKGPTSRINFEFGSR
jgi:hypothetical protein